MFAVAAAAAAGGGRVVGDAVATRRDRISTAD